jgi:hypothetical protein
MKLLVATPMFGGMCAGEYTRSSLGIIPTLNGHGVDVAFAYIYNNSLITSARDQLAAILLQHDFTHMIFIDADIKFDAADIWKMLQADKDVIAGVYPKKEINWHMVHKMALAGAGPDDLSRYTGTLVVNLLNNEKERVVSVNDPAEVFGAGTGFMLIKRSVFEALAPHTDTYVDSTSEKTVNSFFFLMKDPETGRQLSEDYAFCYLCRQHGIKIHVAPWVRLGHAGSYLFEGSAVPVIKEAKYGNSDNDKRRDGRVTS